MKPFFVILFILFNLISQAQTFSELIGKADDLYDEKSYLESGQTYNQAFEMSEGSATQYYNAACSWALTGDTMYAMKYANLAADKGWINLKHFSTDADLKPLHGLKEWKAVLAKVQANLDIYEKDFDQPLKEKLEKIYIKDQTLRQLYQEAETKFGRESEEMKYFWELVSQQDSINEVEVINIIEDYGWVGKSKVGGQANTTLWLVIQHAPIETQEKYLPMLQESVLAGESSGSNLALLEDRIQMRNGKPQTYGSQIVTDEITGKQIVYEVFEPEYVNQRRAKVGLGPIESYVKRWGITWTVEQKVK